MTHADGSQRSELAEWPSGVVEAWQSNCASGSCEDTGLLGWKLRRTEPCWLSISEASPKTTVLRPPPVATSAQQRLGPALHIRRGWSIRRFRTALMDQVLCQRLRDPDAKVRCAATSVLPQLDLEDAVVVTRPPRKT